MNSGEHIIRTPGYGRPIIRALLIGSALLFLAVFLVVPLVTIFYAALGRGAGEYIHAITTRDSLSALKLSLLVAGVAVPINIAFGICAAWLISAYDFKGKSLVLTVLDLPLAVSPVVAGLLFVLLFGRQGIFAPVLMSWGLKVIFAPPGIVLVTVFVTAPYVARELIPLLQERGFSEEEAALTMGAGGLPIFLQVTLPAILSALLYGTILTAARALGEFGAVSVVSGHIRGMTNTLPLHIEILYNEYEYTAAFAVASILTGIALLTLLIKSASGLYQWR